MKCKRSNLTVGKLSSDIAGTKRSDYFFPCFHQKALTIKWCLYKTSQSTLEVTISFGEVVARDSAHLEKALQIGSHSRYNILVRNSVLAYVAPKYSISMKFIVPPKRNFFVPGGNSWVLRYDFETFIYFFSRSFHNMWKNKSSRAGESFRCFKHIFFEMCWYVNLYIF